MKVKFQFRDTSLNKSVNPRYVDVFTNRTSDEEFAKHAQIVHGIEVFRLGSCSEDESCYSYYFTYGEMFKPDEFMKDLREIFVEYFSDEDIEFSEEIKLVQPERDWGMGFGF